MKRSVKGASVVIIVSIVALVTAPGLRTGSTDAPPDSIHLTGTQADTSSALLTVLNRACGDCHSNTMASRWYSRVPPFSAIMARAAREGRNAVNFSDWSTYPAERQRGLLIASCADIRRGTMPGTAYLQLRRDARLAPNDIETICSAAGERGAMPPAKAAAPSRREP